MITWRGSARRPKRRGRGKAVQGPVEHNSLPRVLKACVFSCLKAHPFQDVGFK